jgi:signal transduction histidine kinase
MIPLHIFFPWKSFLMQVIVPTALTIVLFISGIFFMIIPTIEKNSLDRKREMIRELTNSAWNILAKLENDEKNGLLTRAQAQRGAINQIRSLHYGQKMKDYFWVNDMHPRMIIHPYRTDLNGKDLSTFVDPDGKYVFLEFVKVVKEKGFGYVYYKWQSYENTQLFIPKISYVKGFAPWGWIIGTGIYIDDVQAEIDIIIHNVIAISIVISAFIILLLASIIRNSYIAYKKKRDTEEELNKTQSKLSLAGKMASLGRLSAMVAHEINNPISGILSYAKLSTRYLDQDGFNPATIESIKENLSIIASESKRCGDIVKNLLLFTKQSLGEVKEVHLNDVIYLSTKIIDHSVKMKDLKLVTELDSGDDLINCDPGSIQQILVSLIVNAIEASPKGKKIIIRTDYRRKEIIQINLIDFGIGIPEDALPNIFDPFFSTKDSNKSIGLGLSAVYGIVQNHAGTIHVESAVGKGTEFIITFPRSQNLPVGDKK